MARRASSRINPGWWIAALLLCVIAIAGGRYLFDFFGDPYRTLQPLDMRVYMENANSLRGNVYKARGTIEKSLGWHPAKGRMFSVRVDGEGGPAPLPVLVPASLNHINIQQGQQFNLRVEVGGGGVVIVQDMRKQ
ncbi:MAG: hypothetical protein IT577_09205 [Verrucomicrobiae bacterium]|nr:hypothetical protein [Verrucomicrobiae bacterium]